MTESRIVIYGAGMAGLLTAQMLRHRSPLVREGKSSLPNNHGALLRFRTDRVSRLTGIPFRPVMVDKAVVWNGKMHRAVPPLAAQNEYAYKVSRSYTGRSIMNLERGERWIAPPDFVSQLSRGVAIDFGEPLDKAVLMMRMKVVADQLPSAPFISTIPMPVLATMAQWSEPIHFRHWAIRTIRVLIQEPVVDLYQTIYFADEDHVAYRVSITGNLVTIEVLLDEALANGSGTYGQWSGNTIDAMVKDYLGWLGLSRVTVREVHVHDQAYGKLLPLPSSVRRSFVLAMTDRFNIYSVGRFATWRQLLLDDVASDIEVVGKLIADRSMYETRLQQTRSTP